MLVAPSVQTPTHLPQSKPCSYTYLLRDLNISKLVVRPGSLRLERKSSMTLPSFTYRTKHTRIAVAQIC